MMSEARLFKTKTLRFFPPHKSISSVSVSDLRGGNGGHGASVRDIFQAVQPWRRAGTHRQSLRGSVPEAASGRFWTGTLFHQGLSLTFRSCSIVTHFLKHDTEFLFIYSYFVVGS